MYSNFIYEKFESSQDDEGMEDVQVIMDNCNQVTRLTHDILQLTRIRPDDVQFSQVNLSDLVTQVFNYVKQDVKDRSCKLILTPNQYVKADINMLRIAITNLIQNAWKYTSKVDRPIIEFGVLTENSTKVYFIKDNGAGFDSDSTKKCV